MTYQINAKSRTLAPIDNLGIEWDVGTEVQDCGIELHPTDDIYVVVPAGTYNVEAYLEFTAPEATVAQVEWITTDFMTSGVIDDYSGAAATTLTLSATGWSTPVEVYVSVGHSIQGGSATVQPATYLTLECVAGNPWSFGPFGWGADPGEWD